MDWAYRWCRSRRDDRYGELVEIVERGPLGTVHVQFDDGTRQVAHASALRRERPARPVSRPTPAAAPPPAVPATIVPPPEIRVGCQDDQRTMPPIDGIAVRKIPTFAEALGSCGWCSKPIEGPRGAWHRECWRERERLVDKAGLYAAVVERDGLQCGMCGRAGWVPPRPHGARAAARLELEHRVPLWATAHLPILVRRLFFMPANLWLVCVDDHGRKTIAEATLRAGMKACLKDAAA